MQDCKDAVVGELSHLKQALFRDGCFLCCFQRTYKDIQSNKVGRRRTVASDNQRHAGSQVPTRQNLTTTQHSLVDTITRKEHLGEQA